MPQYSGSWPTDGGAVGESLRAPGFSVPALGTSDQWPHRLRAAIDIILACPPRTFLFWGADALFFYNDPIWRDYADVHDRIVGRPYRESFSDLWPVLGPLFERAMAGETCALADLHASARRGGARGARTRSSMTDGWTRASSCSPSPIRVRLWPGRSAPS